MKLKSIKDLNTEGKLVIVRAGFDVPIEGHRVADDFRLREVLPTLEYLVKKGAKIIIATHLGRPDSWDTKLSLRPVAERLAEILKRKFVVVPSGKMQLPEYAIPHLFFFEHNIEKEDISSLTRKLQPGDIAVLENLRFYAGEGLPSEEFAKRLAALGEVYINDAFSDCHRDHASISLLPKLLPAAAGLGLERELHKLSQVFVQPKKPMVLMIGGAKISGKISALENLITKSDYILLGGALASLFLKIRGFEVGKSIVASEDQAAAKSMETLAKQIWRDHRDKIKLPVDAIVATSPDSQPEYVRIDKVKPSHTILDIGPQTILEFSKYLKLGKTLLWTGPLGHFEKPAFSHGTFALARLFASRTRGDAYGVAGGGHTLAVIRMRNLAEFIDHVSTGGGAMMEFLSGKKLPGLVALAAK